jgi:hypothetical protein
MALKWPWYVVFLYESTWKPMDYSPKSFGGHKPLVKPKWDCRKDLTIIQLDMRKRRKESVSSLAYVNSTSFKRSLSIYRAPILVISQ